MTIEEIKVLFPPGTVFYPAHLGGHRHSSTDYITVHENDTFQNIDGSIYLFAHDRRPFPWSAIVYQEKGDNLALIISKPENLPKEWIVQITPDILDIANEYRRKICSREKINYPQYSLMGNDGCGYKTTDATIDTNTFIKIMKSKGIDTKKLKHTLPQYWKVKVTNSNIDLIQRFRNRKGTGTHDKSYSFLSYEGWGTNNNYAEITQDEFIQHCKDIDIPIDDDSSIAFSVPEQWKVKTTDSNMNLINLYRKHKDTGSHDYSYPYLGYQGYGRKSNSSETIIDDATFRSICHNLGIDVEQHKPMMPATPDASNVISSPGIHDKWEDYPKENKRTIPQVNLISVKKRTII